MTRPDIDLLPDHPVVIRFPIHWGEMDAFGHLNNVAYFRYFESGRIAYFERMALAMDAHQGIGPILASTACQYRAPLVYPDVVQVGTRVAVPAPDADRFTMSYSVASEQLGRVVAEGQGVIVPFDYGRGAKAPMPEAWRQAIAAIEGRES